MKILTVSPVAGLIEAMGTVTSSAGGLAEGSPPSLPLSWPV
ncbi:hypothetical protein I546_1267 [Mycobacterium kansasii 732]|nr:hypothetical protein I546_1267 [Mycobacterium kansasii 732]